MERTGHGTLTCTDCGFVSQIERGADGKDYADPCACQETAMEKGWRDNAAYRKARRENEVA